MRIDDQPPHRLVLTTRPNWLLLVVAVVMLVLGGVVATLPAKSTALACTRVGPGEGHCQIVETHLLSRRTVVRFPMGMLLGAEAVPIPWGSGERRFYRLMLAIDDGHGPYYFAWYGDGKAARAAADRITEYAAGEHDVFLRIVNDKRPFFFAVAGALAALSGAFFLWGAQRLTVSFDGAAGLVTIRRRNWRGVREEAHPIEAIAGFHVADWRHDCRLSLVLASGREVPLSASFDAGSFGGPRRVRAERLETAGRLRAFCRLPEIEQRRA